MFNTAPHTNNHSLKFTAPHSIELFLHSSGIEKERQAK